MQKLLLLGDEAIAQGAIDGGMSGIYSYPGTPSTEITEYVQNSQQAENRNIFCNWATNEKTAYETALGMSYAGKRAMSCMKHVGLNVASDAFINSAVTGVNGGLLLVSADDPSMHSSQNEQDSRFYGKFALIPILEPSSQQEAYEMAFSGFEFSEKYKVPVMIRITTRLAHSRSSVEIKDTKPQNNVSLPANKTQFVLLPSIARKQYKDLLNKQTVFEEASNNSAFNQYLDGFNKRLGVIACGIAYNYLLENYPDRIIPFPVVKIGQYPIPRNHIERICKDCDEVLVLEDGYPIVEEQLKGFLGNKKIKGRLDGTIPRDGELNPNLVGIALGIKQSYGQPVPEIVKNRPPSMCLGCSHIDVYHAINEALKEYTPGRVFSDIGCYTLGAYAPFNAINSCVDMGASITMAKGAADAGLVPAVCMIGDSTFTHSGMTGLLDLVRNNTPVTVVISDNKTTGMTGGQDSSGTDKLDKICIGLGVDPSHVRIITPLKKFHEENVRIIKEELVYNGVSVIIPQRECVQTLTRKNREKFKK